MTPDDAPRPAPPAELRAVAQWSLAMACWPLMRYQRYGKYALVDGVTFSACDLPGPGFNYVAAYGPTPPPERVLAAANAFFAGREGGYGVLVEAGAEHPLEAEVRGRGWRIDEEEPALVLPLIPRPPSPPAALEIRRVADEPTLRDYRATADAGFAPEGAGADDAGGPEPSISEALVPSLGCALDPDIALFVGYIEGAPVATSGVLRMEKTANIHGVTTLAPYRRRGIGAAMTWAAIAEGAARGCVSAALRASAMGLPVYLRMGFVPACVFRTYALPGPVSTPPERGTD